jgi:hypothetical protein
LGCRTYTWKSGLETRKRIERSTLGARRTDFGGKL